MAHKPMDKWKEIGVFIFFTKHHYLRKRKLKTNPIHHKKSKGNGRRIIPHKQFDLIRKKGRQTLNQIYCSQWKFQYIMTWENSKWLMWFHSSKTKTLIFLNVEM